MFSGFSNFAAKKSPGFPVPVPGPGCMIHDGDVSQLLNLHFFFQLSRQLFFLFSTFNPKFFRFSNFRAEKNPVQKISQCKRSGRATFRLKMFGRIAFHGILAVRDRSGKPPGQSSSSVGIIPNLRAFSGFRARSPGTF